MNTADPDAQLDALIANYMLDRARGVAHELRPFLVVTPLGRAIEAELLADLARREIGVSYTTDLRDWPRLATALYAPRADRSRMFTALSYLRQWQRYTERATAWWLTDLDSFDRLVTAKADLRARFASKPARVETLVGTRDVLLHPFHVPDRDRIGAEQTIVEAYGDGLD